MRRPAAQTLFTSTEPYSPLGRLAMIVTTTNSRGVMPRSPLRFYGSYAAVYVTRGEGWYYDAGGTHLRIRSGDMIFIFPELAHTYGPDEGGTWDEIYAVFDGPVFQTWRTLGLLDSSKPVRHVEPVSHWEDRFRSLAEEPAETPSQKAIQLCHLLTCLTEIVQVPVESRGTEPSSEWILKACSVAASDLQSDVDLTELARRMGMTAETFRRRFQKTLGLSPIRFRSQKRIEAACHLLQFTSLTLAEIAHRLAYADEFHFSKRFKQVHGLSPTAFRSSVIQFGDIKTHS